MSTDSWSLANCSIHVPTSGQKLYLTLEASYYTSNVHNTCLLCGHEFECAQAFPIRTEGKRRVTLWLGTLTYVKLESMKK